MSEKTSKLQRQEQERTATAILRQLIEREGLLVCTEPDGTQVRVTLKELEGHAAILGKPGRGKSMLLFAICWQLIVAGQTVLALDGKGDLTTQLHSALLRLRRPPQTVAIINTRDKKWSVGLNVLAARQGATPADIGKAVGERIKRAFKEDGKLSPWLDLYMPTALAALSAAGLSLAELEHFARLTPEGEAFRKFTFARGREKTSSGYAERLWLVDLPALPHADQANITNVIRTRAGLLMSCPALLPHIGPCENTLDWVKGLNTPGTTLLADLGLHAGLSEDQSALLGTLLIQEIVNVAWARLENPDAPRNRVYVVIDEAHRFISRDLTRALELLRGLGIHFILSMQTLSQLEEAGPTVVDDVLGCTNVLMSFAVARKDAERLADEVFTGHIDFQERKLEISQTKFRPVLSERTIVSTSEGGSESWASGDSSSSGFSGSEGLSFSVPELGGIPDSWTSSHSDSWSNMRGSSDMEGGSSSWSRSETTVPFYLFEEMRELSSVQFTSLEEHRERNVARVRSQAVQHLIVGVGDAAPRAGCTPTVTPVVAPAHQLDLYCEASNQYFARPTAEVREEIEGRVMRLLQSELGVYTPSKAPDLDEDALLSGGKRGGR